MRNLFFGFNTFLIQTFFFFCVQILVCVMSDLEVGVLAELGAVVRSSSFGSPDGDNRYGLLDVKQSINQSLNPPWVPTAHPGSQPQMATGVFFWVCGLDSYTGCVLGLEHSNFECMFYKQEIHYLH